MSGAGWRLLLLGASGPHPNVLPPGDQVQYDCCLCSNRHWSTIVIGNCAYDPITANPTGRKKHLYTSVDPISAPYEPTVSGGFRWSRRVPPPGPVRLFRARLSPYLRKKHWEYTMLSRICNPSCAIIGSGWRHLRYLWQAPLVPKPSIHRRSAFSAFGIESRTRLRAIWESQGIQLSGLCSSFMPSRTALVWRADD